MTMYNIWAARKYEMPFIYKRDKRGNCSANMNDLWDGAIKWAEHHGHEYVPTYGIKDVAPT